MAVFLLFDGLCGAWYCCEAALFACPFSFVLLDFMMQVCEGVAVYLTFMLFPGEGSGHLPASGGN
jgi:hypothetical protein